MTSDPIMCPHCGMVFDAASPHARQLSPGAYYAYSALAHHLRPGQRYTVTKLADIAGVDHSSLYPHLRQMIRAGLVKRVPKRAGGVYHAYMLVK